MDFYLNEENAYNRLVAEYKKHNRLIIAYDFDDTVFDFHNKGRTYNNVIGLLRMWKDYAYLIVNTGNGKDKYLMIEKYLQDNDIPYNSINENSPYIKNNSNKIYANAYLDDRAGLNEMYEILLKLIYNIKTRQI